MTEYQVRSPAELQAACDRANPGDTILVAGGVYDRPTLLSNRRGTLERPIVIRAADDRWISGGQRPDPAWGGGTPASDSPNKPAITDFAFLAMTGCAQVVIEGLKIRDCWPSILFVKDTTFLTVRGCQMRGGTFAIFAKGESTAYLLIEGNEWQQDDSPEHLLWTQIDWARAHGNEHSDGLYRYFNGGFLSSKGVRGNVILRRNRIMDAFNGVRMKLGDTLPGQNADVHIFDNDFIRIRDNPVEPEVAAHNWHVRHNRLLDCHAWFSFNGVMGGHWYFYGNTGRFESRQGVPGTFGHTMGRVLKLSYECRPPDPESVGVPQFPWFVFNNSWHLRCPLIGGSNPTLPSGGTEQQRVEGPDFTANLDFFNNAFDWCSPSHNGNWVCEAIDLVRNFDMNRSLATSFDYDICDRADFLQYFRRLGQGEAAGLVASRPIFVDSQAGDFSLARNSEARSTGWIRQVTRPTPATPAAPRLQADGTLNRGAFQDYGLIQVPELESQATALITAMGVTV